MATEWYLLSSPYDQLSGFEDEAFDDFAAEGFEEALGSRIAKSVEICNYDLSDIKQIRAIIQNNVQDTKLKSLSRNMLVPIGTCKAGMYVKYKNRFWLIVGLVDDNGFYEKAVMVLCNWLLTWINNNGEIIQRWANVISASQYNNGETGMKFYFVRSDQLLISIPDDDESLLIDTGCRFIIDKRCKIYEKTIDNNVTCDTSHKLITYKLTRNDTVLYNYCDSGHSEFIATQDEQHDGDGYYLIDGKGYWLCHDSKQSIDKTKLLSSSKILCDSDVIFNGLEASIFKAEFLDNHGGIANIPFRWDVKCDFLNKLDITIVDDCISISVDDPKLTNKSFELFLYGEGYEPSKITVNIIDFI